MKIVGRDILDNRGNKFQIFGINVIGFEVAGHGFCVGGMWANNTVKEIAQNIRKAGFNTVRLPVHPKVFENKTVPVNILGDWKGGDNEYLDNPGSLDMLDYFIDALEAEGIYLIIDHHYLDGKGKIPPLWYTNEYTESQWLADLAKLAGRYNGRKCFIGIDIKNEPGKGCTWGLGDRLTDWKAASEKAFYAIDRVNKDCLIIVEPFDTTSINLMDMNPPAIPAERLLLSPHIYGPDVWPWMQGLNDSSFPGNQTASFDSMVGDVAKRRAVYVGEFGGQYGKGPSGLKDKLWQDEFLAYLKRKNIVNVSPWGYGPNSGETGGVTDVSYINFIEDKLAAYKTLKTSAATFIGETGTKPEPEEEPRPEPETPDWELPDTDEPETLFEIGTILFHKSGTGPSILYLGKKTGEYFDSTGQLCRLEVDDVRFEER